MEDERPTESDAPHSADEAAGVEQPENADASSSAAPASVAVGDPEAGQTGLAPTREREPQPWEAAFIEALSLLPNVRAACKAARISRSRAYQVKAEDEHFAAAWATAIEDGLDRVEEASLAAAVVGEQRIHRSFRKDGTLASETIENRTSYQDRRMMLSAYRPARFRERYEVKNTNDDDEVDRDIKELAEALGFQKGTSQASEALGG